jgi:DNA-directed RNA polymerase specialized sigma24 family protein
MAALNPTAAPTETAEAVFERRVAAVSQSVDDFHTYLLKYLFSLTRQWQDAENLLQDLWRYVLLHFDEDKIHALPLLRRKAYHLFLDHYRRQVRRGEVLSDEVPDVPVQQPDFAPFTEDGEAALRERFWSEYPDIALTEKQKEALWLHARYGFTFKEIEERIGVAASTVGDWIVLGRKKLAEIINNERSK